MQRTEYCPETGRMDVSHDGLVRSIQAEVEDGVVVGTGGLIIDEGSAAHYDYYNGDSGPMFGPTQEVQVPRDLWDRLCPPPEPRCYGPLPTRTRCKRPRRRDCQSC